MSPLDSVTQAFRGSGVGRWFYGREQNEQRIIAGLAVLVLISILWAGEWKPVSDWHYVEVNRQQNAQQLIDELNTKRKQDTQVLADYKNALNMQVRFITK